MKPLQSRSKSVINGLNKAAFTAFKTVSACFSCVLCFRTPSLVDRPAPGQGDWYVVVLSAVDGQSQRTGCGGDIRKGSAVMREIYFDGSLQVFEIM